MNSALDKYEKRRQRGEVLQEEIAPFINASRQELLAFLHSPNAKERTIGAVIIGKQGISELIEPLCHAFQSETKLYPRLAMSEALGTMGKTAVVLLIRLLGKIGENQETSLPLTYFNKKSYPLPRDVAARTLTKLGRVAIPDLAERLNSCDDLAAQQAIDALGCISSKTKDTSSLPVLLTVLEKYKANEFTVWKIVRALSGFKSSEAAVNALLLVVEKYTEPAIRWEAIRSIGLIGIKSENVIKMLDIYAEDSNAEIRKAVVVAAEQLR